MVTVLHILMSFSNNESSLCVCSKSFLLSTGGFTCVAFVAGALALWAPLFMEYAIVYQGGAESIKDLESRFVVVSFLFIKPVGRWHMTYSEPES